MKKFFIIIGIICLCIGTFLVINKDSNGQTVKIELNNSYEAGVFQINWENKNQKPLSIILYSPDGKESKFNVSTPEVGKQTFIIAAFCQHGTWKAKVKGYNLGKLNGTFITYQDYAKKIIGKNEKEASDNTDRIVQSMTAASFSPYDGKIVTGSDVITAINLKASKSVLINVTTGIKTKTKLVYTSANYNISDSTLDGYIKSNSNFSSVIGYSSNKTVSSITFVQIS